jgi:hypothetical protein
VTISHETRSKLNAEGGEYKEQRLGKAHGRAVSLEIESDELITLNGALCSSGVQSIWCRALSGVITGTNAALLTLQCFAPPTTAAAATKAKLNQCPPPRRLRRRWLVASKHAKQRSKNTAQKWFRNLKIRRCNDLPKLPGIERTGMRLFLDSDEKEGGL